MANRVSYTSFDAICHHFFFHLCWSSFDCASLSDAPPLPPHHQHQTSKILWLKKCPQHIDVQVSERNKTNRCSEINHRRWQFLWYHRRRRLQIEKIVQVHGSSNGNGDAFDFPFWCSVSIYKRVGCTTAPSIWYRNARAFNKSKLISYQTESDFTIEFSSIFNRFCFCVAALFRCTFVWIIIVAVLKCAQIFYIALYLDCVDVNISLQVNQVKFKELKLKWRNW